MKSPTEPRSFNRELSWLDFNDRVLALASDQSVPLLERVRFAAIAASNLDEFFQVRVAALRQRVHAGLRGAGGDGMAPFDVLDEIRQRTAGFAARHDALVLDDMLPALGPAGVIVVGWDDLDELERNEALELFDRLLHPVLTPLAVDRAHPFPAISNLSLNIGVLISGPGDIARFARVKVPEVLPRFVRLASGRFVTVEQIIASQLTRLFGNVAIVAHATFRVTRSSDIEVDGDDADDLLAAIEIELRRRRFGEPVRLELHGEADQRIVELLVEELELAPADVTRHRAPLGLAALGQLAELEASELRFPPRRAVTPEWCDDTTTTSMFDAIVESDRLVHHPYESFGATVVEFVRTAARDPQTQAIKMTLYRTSRDGVIIDALIEAAQRGVQVVALIELFARFDEGANIEWARRLEDAGAHVVYGLVGLKTHSKCILVVRREGDRMVRYCHIGTGNYNATTARVYEDIGLFTADSTIGDDLAELFNHLTGFSSVDGYQRLIVAPDYLRSALTRLIDHEATFGANGGIVFKINSIVDNDIIGHLAACSQAGAQIDLVVRGICTLRPGVEGWSDNIRVRSILGRFLEHSRIYRFANGAGADQPIYLIGSADLMERNLDRRVEVLVPIDDTAARARLDAIIAANLADDRHVWELHNDGEWAAVGRPTGTSAQVQLTQRKPR